MALGTVGEFCVRDVVVAQRDTGIRELAQLMRAHHVGDVIVAEDRGQERVPVGIVTDRDVVVEVLAEGVDQDSIATGDIMSSDLLTAGEDDDLWTVMERMRDRGVRRVPVVNHRGGLEGILAVDDLLDVMAEQLADIVQLFHRERRHEAHTRTIP